MMTRPILAALALTVIGAPCARAQSSDRPRENRAEPVPYCQLVQDPNKYDGQVVLTEAVWERLFHSGALADGSCLRVAGRAALTMPAFSSELNHDKQWKILGKILTKRGVALVDVIGVFHNHKGQDYGPDGQRYQIEIRSLLAVTEIPKPPPE